MGIVDRMTDEGHAPTIPETEAPTSTVSSTLDPRYALRTLLGRGGMGEVWLAHDGRIDRDIAIKLMRGGAGDADLVARFLREARVQGRLEHPSVVPVHDMSQDAGTPYFAMKRLSGTTLADVLASHDSAKWPRRTLLTRFVDICLAVEFAHARGVIHRDLKPANIMLGDYGETYVLDWGLARITGVDDVIRASDLPSSGSGNTPTEAGAMLGTPGYMAPEQMRGDPIDHTVDVYALGCILFEILTGERAIPNDKVYELTLTVECHHPASRNADVPPELDAACARATAAKPADRHSSARALANEVQRFLDGDRDLERRRQLSAEHVTRAREQLTKDIGEAMREAGSAIALDPRNRDAHAVLAQLLLEPPKVMPVEARRLIDEDRDRAFRPVLLRTAFVFVIALLMVPIAALLGLRGTGAMVVLACETATMAALLAIAYWRQWRVRRPLFAVGLAMHAALLATVGIALGPLLLAPILVFGSLPIALVASVLRMPKTVFAVHFLAIFIPLLLEWLHVVPSSYHFDRGALVLQPWAVDVTPTVVLFSILSITVLQMLGNTLVLDAQRREQDLAQETVHLQRWQFSQLVNR
jgi:serine/threonine-protein kinase